MPLDARQLATDLLSRAYNAGGSLTATFPVGDWPGEMIKEMIDHILANRDQFKLRLKEVRTDAAGFGKFGVAMEDGNSGRYRGVPVAIIEMALFDTMQLVFELQTAILNFELNTTQAPTAASPRLSSQARPGCGRGQENLRSHYLPDYRSDAGS